MLNETIAQRTTLIRNTSERRPGAFANFTTADKIKGITGFLLVAASGVLMTVSAPNTQAPLDARATTSEHSGKTQKSDEAPPLQRDVRVTELPFVPKAIPIPVFLRR